MQKTINIQRNKSNEVVVNDPHPVDHLDSLSYLNYGIIIGTVMFFVSLLVKVFQNS